jgi:hypothetical protein
MLSIPSPWLERLAHQDHDPNQRIGARYLLKVVALQRGDWEAAEQYRREAELLALQNNASSMFSTLGQELEVHAAARDLTGLKQLKPRIAAMAARYPGWKPVLHVAEAHYMRLCGDLAGALRATAAARSCSASASVRSSWAMAAATLEVEVLAEAGRADEGLVLGQDMLAECQRDGMRHVARGLAHAVAFAEAKLGHNARAMSRLQEVIREQVAMHVTGLQLGRSYELCARIALCSRDASSFEAFAQLTAEQYRPGESSVLGALYERLMEEACEVGLDGHSIQRRAAHTDHASKSAAISRVTSVLTSCGNRTERAQCALRLLCEDDPTRRGHLFLFTERGLVLAASSVTCSSALELTAFAQSCIDVELEHDSTGNTATQVVPTRAESLTGRWRDADGISYSPLLLGVRLHDGFSIAGVALIADGATGRQHEAAGLAPALAKSLIACGDAQAVGTA